MVNKIGSQAQSQACLANSGRACKGEEADLRIEELLSRGGLLPLAPDERGEYGWEVGVVAIAVAPGSGGLTVPSPVVVAT